MASREHVAGLLRLAARADLRPTRGMCEGSWVERWVRLASMLRSGLAAAPAGLSFAALVFAEITACRLHPAPFCSRGQCAACVGVGVCVPAAAPFAFAVWLHDEGRGRGRG